MKRIVLVILLVVVLIMGLFVLTGCKQNSSVEQSSVINSTSNGLDKEDSVNKLHFKYSSGANIKDSTNGKMIENENYNIIVSYQKDKSSDELEKARAFTFISADNINKIEWNKFSYIDSQVSTITYMYDKDNGTYVVTISHDASKDINLDKEIEEFMNNIIIE